MTEPIIVAWVGTCAGAQVVYGSNAQWPNEWWYLWQIDQAIATTIPNAPQPRDHVTDVRALSHDDYDLLLHEYRARRALREAT